MQQRDRIPGTINDFRAFVNAETVVPKSVVHTGKFGAGEEETIVMPAIEPEVIPGDHTQSYPFVAMKVVKDHVLAGFDTKPDIGFYVVWFCKILQHWKALVGTTMSDGRYYEVTYNGDKDEVYLDDYSKKENIVFTRGMDRA